MTARESGGGKKSDGPAAAFARGSFHLRYRRALLRLRLYEDLLRDLTQYERPFTHRGDFPGLHMFFR